MRRSKGSKEDPAAFETEPVARRHNAMSLPVAFSALGDRYRQGSRVKMLRTVVSLLAAACIVSPAAPVDATHGDTANSGDLFTRAWDVCISTPDDGRHAFVRAMNEVNETHVNAQEVGCVNPDNRNVAAYARQYPDSWFGQTICSEWNSNGSRCEYKLAYLNLRTAVSGYQREKTALHEFGHVGGLGHRTTDNSAMTSGTAPPISNNFDPHDREAINNTYP